MCSGLNATVCQNVDTDLDNDNYSPRSVLDAGNCNEDCNDSNALIRPNKADSCGKGFKGIDDNCNGIIDDGEAKYFNDNGCGGSCALTNPKDTVCDSTSDSDNCLDDKYVCNGRNATICQDVDTDNDNDGYSACISGCSTCDCNDSDGSIRPGTTETCNGKDDNCNGYMDEGLGGDSGEPGNDNAWDAPIGMTEATINDCNNSPQVSTSGKTLNLRAGGTSDPADWYWANYYDCGSFNYDDRCPGHGTDGCSGTSPYAQFLNNTGNGMKLCLYFKCQYGDNRLKSGMTCRSGTKVTDGTDIDPTGQGCCCTGNNCVAGTDNWDCDGTDDESGWVYVRITPDGATPSCQTTYSFKIDGE